MWQRGTSALLRNCSRANTQADTLEEARANLAEAVTLVLEANRQMAEESLQGKDIIRELLFDSAS